MRILLFLCAILAAFPHALAANLNEPALVAPLLLDTENLGDVWVYPHGAEDRFHLESAGLLEALARGLEESFLADVRTVAEGADKVSLAALRKAGLSLRFDEAALVLRLEPSDEQRARKSVRVRRGSDREERETLGPAAFSGYVNATATQGFLYPEPRSRQAFRGNLSLVSNLRGFVLETGATFQERELYEWRRDDTRLTRDFEDQLVRLSLGDVPVQGVGYQGSRPLGGISLTRQYSIQPYLNTRPLSRTEIQLARPSTIEVYVNDGFVNRLNAPAGPLQLADFPLFSGVNKVDLKITDDAGRVEWVNLNLLYDVQLLGKGIQEFAYQFGAPSETFEGDRRYDDRNMTFSFFHRLGLSDRLTVGASFQSDKSLWMGATEFVGLTRLGLFSGEAALSHRSYGPDSSAGRLRFKSLDYKRGNDKPWRGTLEVEYRSRLFASLGAIDAANAYDWRYDATISRPLTALTSLSLGGRYEQNRVGGPDRRGARVDFNTQMDSRLRLAANYALERTSRTDHSFQLSLTWVDLGGRYYGNLSYDYPSRSARVEATRNSANVVDDFRATVGAQAGPALSQVDGFVDYTHEKANLRAEHASSRSRETNGGYRTLHRSQLTAATAVAWAGNTVAWTRPIADSFAILRARPLFRRFDLPVNKVEENAEARVNRAGPAVIPTITAYNPTPLTVDSSGLPMGYSLGREFFLARPTYKSGVLVNVGGESTVLLTGTLLKPDGAALSYASGKVVAMAPEAAPAPEFFTNGEGVFLLENLLPGTYEIRLDGFKAVRLDVPAGASGFQRFKPYRVKAEE